MDKMVLFFPEGHQNHQLFGHPERPERIDAIQEGLLEMNLWESLTHIPPIDLKREHLERTHTPDYINTLEAACEKGMMLDPDTYTTKASWQLALNAAGGAVSVVDTIWDGKYQTGFALSRPPGHHATQNRGMGFCLINNIAVAADYLIQEKNANHITILDIDLHHGNGTQDIFWARGDVSFCSIHQSPFYPGTGYLDERGVGEGEGRTMNLPIPAFSGDEAYKALLRELVLPFLSMNQPDMLLISFGFDTHWRDPLGSMQLSAGCIHQLMRDLREWVNDHCDGKIAVILEGGYDLEAGKACGGAIAAALADVDWQDGLGPSPTAENDSWQGTLEAGKDLWGL